ncbi:DNA processing protein [Catalinimonas alkaloidigena]|uniref:DNA processing protein n=1 Tax=Catalinimonas alkaloidigena TaxID=1075417 RepID=A0A1G9BYI3_9BACT|nr:DNA-processing protein DprA [Catalinimonas alkaloidigena]SDK44477.1 DNA processing protein [Catalinimonas alkaloidigena]
MKDADEILYRLALSFVPKVGSVLTRQLIGYCGSAKAVFTTPRGKLLRIPGIGKFIADNIQQADLLVKAERELALVEKHDVQLLWFTDEAYPSRLKHLPDSPPLLYYQGTASLNHARIVGIVGTRQATDYGRSVTEQIVRDLVPHECLVVSGLAYGIDITAHRAAVQHQLPTIGVMANGLDLVYPAAHKATAQQMRTHGGLLTENPFGTKPDAPQFPARNRIIAGLCDALVVVEAAAKGGALITADMAHQYDREVLAVPGNLGNPYSEGCNRLIRQLKAAIYTNIEDLEKLLNWDLDAPARATTTQLHLDESLFSAEELSVLQVLRQQGAQQIDELGFATQLAAGRLASLLLNLEFQGMIKALPGKKYCLTHKK